MHIVARALHSKYFAVRESLFIYLLIYFNRQAAINKQCGALVGSQFPIKTNEILNICYDRVKVDAPFHEFSVTCLIIHEVASYEVRDTWISEALLNHVHGCLACFTLYVKCFDLLNTIYGLLNLLLIGYEALRAGVNADHALHAIWVEACDCHRGLGSDVVPQQGELVDALLISKSKHILCHLAVCHALVVVGLAMVAEVDEVHVSLR